MMERYVDRLEKRQIEKELVKFRASAGFSTFVSNLQYLKQLFPKNVTLPQIFQYLRVDSFYLEGEVIPQVDGSQAKSQGILPVLEGGPVQAEYTYSDEESWEEQSSMCPSYARGQDAVEAFSFDEDRQGEVQMQPPFAWQQESVSQIQFEENSEGDDQNYSYEAAEQEAVVGQLQLDLVRPPKFAMEIINDGVYEHEEWLQRQLNYCCLEDPNERLLLLCLVENQALWQKEQIKEQLMMLLPTDHEARDDLLLFLTVMGEQ